MAFYILLTSIPTRDAPKPERIVNPKESTTKIVDISGILRADGINRIIWRNLERIDYHIYQDIKKVVCSEKYNWARGSTSLSPTPTTIIWTSLYPYEWKSKRYKYRPDYLIRWRDGYDEKTDTFSEVLELVPKLVRTSSAR
jgi:hypothetical protein